MKLRNKKTGEIVVFGSGIIDLNQIGCKNVAEMIEAGWEDYEEPKDFWWLDNECNVNHASRIDDCLFEKNKQIGNYFETREEAEKAVEKLKAWKRLKDKGFKFTDWNCPCRELEFAVDEEKFFKPSGEINEETRADLDLLFGGE